MKKKNEKKRRNPAFELPAKELEKVALEATATAIAKAVLSSQATLKLRASPDITPDVLTQALKSLTLEVWIKDRWLISLPLCSIQAAGVPEA